jgi:hypothetical protein
VKQKPTKVMPLLVFFSNYFKIFAIINIEHNDLKEYMNESEGFIKNQTLLISSKDFFKENLTNGVHRRKLKLYPQVIPYLTDLLEYFMFTNNLHEEVGSELNMKRTKTLAELFLEAQTAESHSKISLLKKLGDRTLYVSGFFSDSLNRSLVDLDYYKTMGVSAYYSLSDLVSESTSAKVYHEIACKFTELTDLLTLISQESMIRNDQSILRLYESYLKTGSELAKEKLKELGVIPISEQDSKKVTNQ